MTTIEACQSEKIEILRRSIAEELDIQPTELDFKRDMFNTKWKCKYKTDDDGNVIHIGDWEYECKSLRAPPLPDNIPRFRDHCHCTTRIQWQHLARHIPSGIHFIIGNECIKHTSGSLARTCIMCNTTNRRKSLYCKPCHQLKLNQLKCKIDTRTKRKYFECIKLAKLEQVEYDKLTHIATQAREAANRQIRNECIKRLQQLSLEGRYTFGPYIGKTIADIANTDPHFIIRSFKSGISIGKRTRSNMMQFVGSIQNEYAKHPNMTYDWLFTHDRSYLEWIMKYIPGNDWIAEWVMTQKASQVI